MSFDKVIENREEVVLEASSRTPKQLPHLRRNFILFFLDFALFGTAFTLIGNTTVVPDFVRHLTNSEQVIGFAGSIYSFSWLLPQLLFAQLINRSARRKPWLTFTTVPFRMVMAVMALSIALSGPSNQNAILLIFLTGYTLFAATDGLTTIVWADMIGGAMPERLRGVLFSAGQFVVAFGALVMRTVVRTLLGPDGPAFPQNYAQMFGIAAILFVLAGLCLALLVEEKSDAPAQIGPTFKEYLPYVGNVLRQDRAFRYFIITRGLLDFTMIAAPFYIVFGAERLNLPSATLVGDSILLATVGGAVSALLMTWLSHRYGSRAVIGLIGVACVIHPILALLSISVGYVALYGAFFMLGFVTTGVAPGYIDWIITYAPPERRPIYIGLTNTLGAVSQLAPLVGGFVLALSGSSYTILFGLSLVIGLAGFGSVRFLAEPRQLRANRSAVQNNSSAH